MLAYADPDEGQRDGRDQDLVLQQGRADKHHGIVGVAISSQQASSLCVGASNAPSAQQAGIGIMLKRDSSGQMVVMKVLSGGPSDGLLLVGDVLKEVDGACAPAEGWQMADVLGLILGIDRTWVTIGTRRGDNIFRTSIQRVASPHAGAKNENVPHDSGGPMPLLTPSHVSDTPSYGQDNLAIRNGCEFGKGVSLTREVQPPVLALQPPQKEEEEKTPKTTSPIAQDKAQIIPAPASADSTSTIKAAVSIDTRGGAESDLEQRRRQQVMIV